ncbi:hypothetical protein [Pseudomonas citronellolis]|uniref:hypothetical protein n=1 Tax=Pseudomonas citronellolis TaxID=53408 RepID=UPI00209EB4FD|nr:hypothetical protein [Pseudomonas citronellolis]MCP1605717.1 hypothetical protein [Pseudomonas citronellolis]MCP1656129.1 hypothetical protein [Pseudomonas citronellolis]MCP1722289.1 hypothetical protein [Pseudomonas citronellolis]
MTQTTEADGRFPYKELFERMVTIRVTPSTVIVLPEGTPIKVAEKIANALKMLLPVPPLVVVGDVRCLDVGQMNDAGWYRA